MKGKIILITGATGGIGKAAAMEFAKQGATVIVHGRSYEKTLKVVAEIKQATSNQQIDLVVADLFLMADVKRMAAEVRQKYDHLDVLINNAGGIMSLTREITAEGFEKTIAVNLFAPFLLTGLLLDLLRKSPDGRVINVSSSSHKLNAKPDYADFQGLRHYSPLIAYGNAKLYLIWISQLLSKKLRQQGINNVAVNVMHPGAVASNFGRDSNLGFLNVVAKLVRPFFRSNEKGAETIIYLASPMETRQQSGKYFIDKKPVEPSRKYYSEAHANAIWNYCEEQTGFQYL